MKHQDTKKYCIKWITHRLLILLHILFGIPLAFLLTFIVIPASFEVSFGTEYFYLPLIRWMFKFANNIIDDNKPLDIKQQEIHDAQLKMPSLPSKTFNNEKDKIDFNIDHIMNFTASGMQAIVDDEVLPRFWAAELSSWNLLTRTKKKYQFKDFRLTLLWILGIIIRYALFLPIRTILFAITLIWFFLTTVTVCLLPVNTGLQRKLHNFAYLTTFRTLARAIGGCIKSFNSCNRAKVGGVCVTNHASPLDSVVLSRDRCYAMVGQKQGGLLGILIKSIMYNKSHLLFERSEANDRKALCTRMKEHIKDDTLNPLLIYPEGTCVNSTGVLLFKKGAFEIGGTIYPVALEYDLMFGDIYWNSLAKGWLKYLIGIFTCWGLVCNVHYLPPTKIKPNETVIAFANRVKTEIAKHGQIPNLPWDGQLKRLNVKKSFRLKEQEFYSKILNTE
ncbi:Glycerol-3-phosphate acyltransferase 3 [Trichoplax sp. H2]|nr:Glycerol-3-phosphate acyltransferase 3 [Trichoplax sp. H2]|eukprot:RDD43543.1 Glycerol-3-phosphate acyltransferase 3 [Trichoplax sp. H2]